MDIDEAIDRFLAAVERAGLPAVKPPDDLASLSALEAALAPLRVPAAVRRFWERVDTTTLRARAYPGFHGPDFALTCWNMGRDEFAAYQPSALLQIAYESHQCMSVELDQPGVVEGGALFEWNVVDGGFERRFNALQSWLSYLTELLDSGRFAAREAPDGPFAYVPAPEDFHREPTWRPPLDPHPVHGTAAMIGRDILEWPPHWQRLAGLTPERMQPRGATHTIDALLRSDPSRPLEATVHACVVALVGGAAGSTVRLDDTTGQVVVHCPAHTTLLGPVIGDWFEFDVSVPAGVRHVPMDPDGVGLDEPDPQRRVEQQFLAQYGQPAAAVATAVRRADRPRS